MNDQPEPSSYVPPAILAGLLTGVMTLGTQVFISIIPLIGMANCCCCIIGGMGGGLAVTYHLRQNPESRMSLSDSALCGMLSGVTSGLVYAGFWVFAALLSREAIFDAIRKLGFPREFIQPFRESYGQLWAGFGCFSIFVFTVLSVLMAMATLKLLHSDQSA